MLDSVRGQAAARKPSQSLDSTSMAMAVPSKPSTMAMERMMEIMRVEVMAVYVQSSSSSTRDRDRKEDSKRYLENCTKIRAL